MKKRRDDYPKEPTLSRPSERSQAREPAQRRLDELERSLGREPKQRRRPDEPPQRRNEPEQRQYDEPEQGPYDAPPQQQFDEPEPRGGLRNEQRNERMHVRVQLPFRLHLEGRRYAGHDISVSGLSTERRPDMAIGDSAEAEIDIRCNGFRTLIPVTLRLHGERGREGARFEITDIAEAELSILRRLIRAHLSGTHLTFEQLSAQEDAQTVRERAKRTIRPPNPAPSLIRFGTTLAAVAVLLVVIGAALYERLFVIEPEFAAVTAPEIRIYAPTDGELAPHEFDPGDEIKRDEVLVEVKDPQAEAQLALARATFAYNERMLENLRASLEEGGGGTIVTSGAADGGAPTLTELTPLELRARIREFETTYGFAKAKVRALEARSVAGTVYAPCDCIVHSIRSGDGGYWVEKSALIAQLIRSGPEDVTVEALVHLGEISNIEPNERAEVVMPTTGETRSARVTAIQLESQHIERAGFPEWARQDMSHGSVILAMEEPLPPGLVGHPVEVRFIDTDSLGGEAIARTFGVFDGLFRGVLGPIKAAFTSDGASRAPQRAKAAE